MRAVTVVAWAALSASGVAVAADVSRLPDTIDRVRHAIVAVGTNEPTRNPTFRFLGTGFVVGDGTLVATNNHVLPPVIDPTKLEVVGIAVPVAGGEPIFRVATIVARDVDHDVGILRISGPPLPALRFGDSAKVREGESFAFIGFPIGGAIGLFPTTHRATISAITPVVLTPPTARSLDPAMIKKLRADRFAIFQLDATAYPGNSGSPMFDIETGDVVGIVNSTLAKSGKETLLTQPSGISYAIPSLYFTRLVDSARDAPR
jgi:serine protease Do